MATSRQNDSIESFRRGQKTKVIYKIVLTLLYRTFCRMHVTWIGKTEPEQVLNNGYVVIKEYSKHTSTHIDQEIIWVSNRNPCKQRKRTREKLFETSFKEKKFNESRMINTNGSFCFSKNEIFISSRKHFSCTSVPNKRSVCWEKDFFLSFDLERFVAIKTGFFLMEPTKIRWKWKITRKMLAQFCSALIS